MSTTTDAIRPPDADLAVADPSLAPASAGGRPHWIDDWRPEDPEFWETTGRSIARRNLIVSILSEHIGLSVWSLWSVFVRFPVGGWQADRFGGARVTIVNFMGMAAGAGLVLAASMAESLPLFIVAFIALFTMSGLGNGSTYKMIPAIFQAKVARKVAAGADMETEARNARRLSRALIGIAGSVGAFGGVFVNLGLRQSFLSNGSADAAYIGFIAFYLVCVVVTWAVYLRPSPKHLAGV